MMTLAGFFILLLCWLCLPFIPGIVEIRRKADAKPLSVVREYDVDVHYFANAFRRYIQEHLANAIVAVNKTAEIQQGKLADSTQYYVLNQDQAIPFQQGERQQQFTQAMYVSSNSLNLPGTMSYLTELYAKENIAGGEEDIYRALLAEDSIRLGESSMLLRWMHAGKRIEIPNACVLHGRVSADQEIVIAPGCHFERLHAPQIIFGVGEPAAYQEAELTEIKPEDLAVSIEEGGGRWLIEKDLTIPEDCLLNANLVVVGKLTIGANTRVNGSVKSHQELRLEEHVFVDGSVVSGEDIYIANRCAIRGPLVSERKVTIGSDCRVGSVEKPTTISAEHISITADSMAHGTVWARIAGKVVAAEKQQ